MSDESPDSKMSSTKKALLEIRRLRAELDDNEQRQHAPIAIIGCGVRFPGNVTTAQQYWDFLEAGKDAVGEIPSDRWDVNAFYDPDRERVGKMYTRSGGYLSSVDRFDSQFFGISPREAASMDPQHRLLLEVTWEALENAGQSCDALRGSRSGVFIGLCNSDYSRLVFNGSSTPDVSAATGNESSVAAGRISYILGLQGPSLVVDTACSSSLVALHLAVQSLRRGECDLALVGGVNLILSPEMHINFCQAQMLSPDGRCKTFDVSADGYGRGEGCGVVVLKRLVSARQDNDRILASVRGTAINQDGKSAGLTAPNGPAQESVIRDAILDAGITAADIGYVEAHGTGTPLGDPIEAGALGAAIGAHRDPASPLLIGSAKTNFGHLEAAAGIAGVIKTALGLYHRRIPKHLNYSTANPEIPLDGLNLKVVSRSMPWPTDYSPIAGVSSFGFSGTNAHVILEGVADEEAASIDPAGSHEIEVLTISAQTEVALRESVDRFRKFLIGTAKSLRDIAYTSTVGRAQMEHRLALVCHSTSHAAEQLEEFSNGKELADVKRAHVRKAAEPPRVVVLFPGQGLQYPGMGKGLYDRFPVYRAALERVAALFDSKLGADPLVEVIHSTKPDDERTEEALYTQPATFAVTYALYELWCSWGLRAEIVLGHSLGEYMAALASGILQLDDAVTMVAERARLTSGLASDGSMAVVFAGSVAVQEAIDKARIEIDIAAINAPQNTVVSGSDSDVSRLLAILKDDDVDARRLNVSHAFHSRLLDPILDQFERVANGIEYGDPHLAMLSNVSGDFLRPGEAASAMYWRDHLRKPVQFQRSIAKLQGEPNTIMLELGPHPALLPMVEGQIDSDSKLLAALRRNSDDVEVVLEALSEFHVHGGSIDWRAYHRSCSDGSAPGPVEIPTYPFRAERHWVDVESGLPGKSSNTSAWRHIVAAATAAAGNAPLNLRVDSLEAAWLSLRSVSKCYIVNTLLDLGIFAESGSSETLESVLSKGGVVPTYRHLIERWLRLLVDEELLGYDAKRKHYCCAEGLTATDVADSLSNAHSFFASEGFIVDYVQRCGEMLPRVISGDVPALETLFPGGSTETAEQLYSEYSVSKYISNIAAAAVAAVAASQTRLVQVLEIGAGTGGTTAAVLPALPPGRVRYCFTDISDYFLGQAAQRFDKFDFLDYRILDIGKDTDEQGYSAHSIDVIVATNVLHATPDLRQTLNSVLQLLKSDGVLVLSEVTRELAWFDITTGLIEGWQSFDDDLRDDSPLLASDIWETALVEAGFEEVVTLPADESGAAAVGQNVLLARAPAREEADFSGRVIAGIADAVGSAAIEQPQDGIIEKLRDVPDSERHDVLTDHVIGLVCMILRLPESSTPDGLAGLFDLGLDSLMALDFRRRLAASLNLDGELPATLVFDYPNAEAIVGYLEENWLGIANSEPGMQAAVQHSSSQASSTISNEAIENLSDKEIEALLEARLSADTQKVNQ